MRRNKMTNKEIFKKANYDSPFDRDWETSTAE